MLRAIAADPGSVEITGSDALMMGRGFTLVAEAGSYIVAGAIADLTQVKLNERILDVDVRIRVVDVDSRNGL